MLDWSVGNSTTAPTAPIKCRLMTANGSDSSAGTEVAGGSYVSQTVTFSAASSGSTSNSGDLVFSAMPSCTVVGVELWDSAGSPVRIWYGALTVSKAVNSGDTFKISAGSLSLSLD
jgi:hypothetical protein